MKCDPNFSEFLPIHCIIHREHLAAKHFKYEDVIKTILEISNSISINWKNHRRFHNFEEELKLEDAPSNVFLYCVVRWLSTSNVLSMFVDLLKPINLFLDEKRKCYPQLKNNASVKNFMFLTAIMKNLQILNLALQGTKKIISDLAQTGFSFKNRIKFFNET